MGGPIEAVLAAVGDSDRARLAQLLADHPDCLRSLEALLDFGADPTIRDATWDSTPGGWAEHSGETRAVELLGI